MDKPSLAYKIILEESGKFEAYTLNYGEEKRGTLSYIFLAHSPGNHHPKGRGWSHRCSHCWKGREVK